jgi:DNA-binding transcriptional MerR regulator
MSRLTFTVGRLARQAGLARSTLLYYDRIGLLSPTGRTASGYRVYGQESRARLAAIRAFREVGLGLAEIQLLLSDQSTQAARILTARLERVNEEIAQLREQQRVIVRLLKNRRVLRKTRALDQRRWIEILAAAGLDDAAMHRWHVHFEALAPEAHGDFLESLGIPPLEVASIRAWSRQAADQEGSPARRSLGAAAGKRA